MAILQNPTNTTATLLPAPAQQVEWPSIVWAFLPLALNAMSQPSVMDGSYPFSGLFPARSSPIICAIDALEAVSTMLVHVWSGQKPIDAAYVFRERRRRQGLDTSLDRTISMRPLSERCPMVHLVLFVLGPLPQALKLWGMKGIPWTQVWASVYMSSFVLVAVMHALAPPPSRARDMSTRGSDRFVRHERFWDQVHRAGLIVEVLLWVWCLNLVLARQGVFSQGPRKGDQFLKQLSAMDFFLYVYYLACSCGSLAAMIISMFR